MRSTHYPIELARTYDMTQIEERVRLRGQAFERLDGLALKAFLVRSASNGAMGNWYTFYVWTTTRVRLWADEDSAGNVGPGAERFDVLRVVGPALTENR